VRPLVTEVVGCDPRHNKLLQSGNKNDRVDERADARDELARAATLNYRTGSGSDLAVSQYTTFT